MTSSIKSLPSAAADYANSFKTGRATDLSVLFFDHYLAPIAKNLNIQPDLLCPLTQVWEPLIAQPSKIESPKHYERIAKTDLPHGAYSPRGSRKIESVHHIASYCRDYKSQIVKCPPGLKCYFDLGSGNTDTLHALGILPYEAEVYRSLSSLDNLLSMPKLCKLPMQMLLQLASTHLNKLNKNDLAAFIAYNTHEKLSKPENKKQLWNHPFKAFQSSVQDIREALQDHPRYLDFLLAFKEEKINRISAVLINEIHECTSEYELNHNAAFQCLNEETQERLIADLQQKKDHQSLLNDVEQELISSLATLKTAFTQQYAKWSTTLNSIMLRKNTSWAHALTTIEFLALYVYSNAKHSTLEDLSKHPFHPNLLTGSSSIKEEVEYTNKLVKFAENNFSGNALTHVCALLPGSTNPSENHQWLPHASAQLDVIHALSVSALFRLLPQTPHQTPASQRQNDFLKCLAKQVAPAGSNTSGTFLLSLYMPQKEQLSPSQTTILSLIDTFRDSLLQKIKKKFSQNKLNHNEEILMLLSLLLRPSALPKSELIPQIDGLSTPLYIAFNQHHGLPAKTNAMFNKVTTQLRGKPEFVSSIERNKSTPGVFRPYLTEAMEDMCSLTMASLRSVHYLEIQFATITVLTEMLFSKLDSTVPASKTRKPLSPLYNLWTKSIDSMTQLIPASMQRLLGYPFLVPAEGAVQGGVAEYIQHQEDFRTACSFNDVLITPRPEADIKSKVSCQSEDWSILSTTRLDQQSENKTPTKALPKSKTVKRLSLCGMPKRFSLEQLNHNDTTLLPSA